MRTPGRSSKALVATITTLLTIAGGTAALADQLVADGDTLTSGPNVSVTACGVAHAFTGSATVSFQGGGNTPHFAGGAVVTLTAAPSAEAAAAGITATGGTLTLPTPWTSASPNASTSISLSVPAGIATGTYKVGMTASGNRAGGGTLSIPDSYNVLVNCPANTPPTVTVPGTVSVQATSSAGATVTYTASANDVQDGSLTPTCAPPSGSTFHLGSTNVTCNATDSGGLTGSASFSVIVIDTTAPVLALPADLTEEAAGPGGVGVSFSASASDLVSGAVPVICQPVSGAIFPLGATEVSCSATDAANNKATGSFTITVVDTTAPDVSVPASASHEATGPGGAPVAFSASATDLVDGDVQTTCDHDSGDTFPLGVTEVTCSATDTAGNTGHGSFTVSVVDTTAPNLGVPGPASYEATGPDGAAVSFVTSAADLVDGDLATTCDHDSGDTFPLGVTEVTCSATDTAGNTGHGSFTISVVDTTAPSLLLVDVTSEATGAAGAIVTFTAAAEDLVDGPLPAVCDHGSGEGFPLGDTIVTCTATDAHSNAGTGSFRITVQDTTAPVLVLPLDIVAEATGPDGAAVFYSASAHDLVDGPVPPACGPGSGGTFSIGTTPVGCSATDAHGNTSGGSFDVTVQDTTAPSLTLPGDITVEATGPGGAAVTFGASATDAVDGSVTPDCDATSGATFPLGLTTVTCSATDAHGNTSGGSFDVTVQDTTAASLTLPSDITVMATSAAGATVAYTASAADVVDGALAISCSPVSGATFPVGTTTVACSAIDAHGNQATGNFKVKVAYAFNGFFQPVDNPVGGAITWNKAKAGSAIPVKFSLGGDRGMNILADGALLASMFPAPPAGPSSSPWAEKVTCGSAVSEDSIESTVTANASGLLYDQGAKQYSYVWKTSTSWANSCRVLHVLLKDGTDHVAYVHFTK